MPSRFVVCGLLCLLLLRAAPADAQHRCGGHTIEWIGGPPRTMFDRGPLHSPPTRPEPDTMSERDRELWDALVFDAYDHPMGKPGVSPALEERHTMVLGTAAATAFRLCIQSADESYTGQRLQRYANAEWWGDQVQRFVGYRWGSGIIEIGACTGDAPKWWVYVREGEPGEVNDGALAHAVSRHEADSRHVVGDWFSSEIVFHSADRVRDTPENWFESTLAHELGHVLGLSHVPPSSGFVMQGGGARRTWPDKERWLSQWVYAVGRGVEYPGFVRLTAPEPGDLKGGVKDLVDEALDDLQDDSDGRQATETVPSLPAAGVLLLATLLGLLGRLRLRAR